MFGYSILAPVYQPLFLKYRPQTFAQLVGQDHVVVPLSNALTTGRMHHAYLFTGSRGTGKTSSARIFAKAVNCVKGPTPEPCGVCHLCQAITQGSALDVIEIDAASNTGVDNIRELIERAQLAPASAKYKVYLIDEVHMLSNAAFNSLLKTLEEPPQRVIFILATTDPQRVLPTIISRCQRFDFKRIALEPMTKHLKKIADLENIPITIAAIELIAQIAQGGLRDAESLLDQLSLLSETIQPEHVWDLVGAVPERDLLKLLEAIRNQDTIAIISQSRHLIDRGREPIQVLQDLVGFLRDVLLAKVAPQEREWVALTKPTWDQLVALGPHLDQNWLLQLQNTLRSAEPLVKHSTQPRLWLEVTLLDLTRVTTVASIPLAQTVQASAPPQLQPSVPQPQPLAPQILPQPTATQTQPTAPITAPPIAPKPVPPVASAPPELPVPQPVGGLRAVPMSDFLAAIKSQQTKAIMRDGESKILFEDDAKIVFGLKDKFFLNMLNKDLPKHSEELFKALKLLTGKRPTLNFQLAPTDTTTPQSAPTQSATPSAPTRPTPIPARTTPATLPTSTVPMSTASVEEYELDATAKSVASFFNGIVISDQPIERVQEALVDDDDDF